MVARPSRSASILSRTDSDHSRPSATGPTGIPARRDRLAGAADQGNLDEDGTHYTEDGIYQIVYAASILTQTYRIPERLDDWSRWMASRLYRFYGFWAQDHLWICSMGWQGGRETVKTMNGVVDWWLILIPGGIDVRNFDETRTQILITPVFSRFNMPRFYGEFWNFMAKAVKFPGKSGPELSPVDPTWLHVSHMDRKRACLFVNERIAQSLTETL